ncbi:hypothetical protein KIN20_001865 [Parelaphostrongylus tenuis]|uniref:Uncharacterized protein n=1 Tax=Parelaphostrongylus tenuis TaxID=148309 RepID=A0AAD5LUD3_PARTN|nr:hypothetical protein KIN20_001865 [Parelaphostrongylus tenuis]
MKENPYQGIKNIHIKRKPLQGRSGSTPRQPCEKQKYISPLAATGMTNFPQEKQTPITRLQCHSKRSLSSDQTVRVVQHMVTPLLHSRTIRTNN